jgi:phosphoenolpyruvate---glycerone phosphotransferase subunit DhaL
MFDVSQAKAALHAVRLIMEKNRDRLIELDSAVGDGDLGLTMCKAFIAADQELGGSSETDVGRYLMQAGMTMAKAAPSTMGTLVGTGFMRGGKALKDKTECAPWDLGVFFRAFSDGVMERGKTKPGNKTIVDVLEPVAVAAEKAASSGDMAVVAAAILDAAGKGEEAARGMMSEHGKAAIYREQTIGKPDPGAVAGRLMIEAFVSVLMNESDNNL